jgi:glycerophosphoryl diester phosphodiesterase
VKSLFFLAPLFFVFTGCKSSSLKSQAPTKNIQVHGHRGSRGTHPENTLSAFEEAVSTGVDWLELDLVLSKEDVPVVSHDATISVDLCLDARKKPLSRVIPIKTQTVKHLKTYDCGSVPNPLFPEQRPVPGQTFVTLEEVLIWAKNFPEKKVRFNIETKTSVSEKQFEPDPRNFVDSIIRLLRKYHQIENSILQSFDFRTLVEARKMEPSLKLSALFDRPGPMCKTTKNLGAAIASPNLSLITQDMVKECHSLGIEVHPWTLNQESEWKSAISMGVDGIITDYPRKLTQFLISSAQR